MLLHQHTITLWLFVIFTAAATIFALGYFPLSFSNDERSSLDDLPTAIDDVPLNRSGYQSHYAKSVLMIIDALRLDFAHRPEQMRYVHKLLATSDNVCMLHIHVQSPTVTLPRIKSITTGTVPNFIDVALNFGSAALSIDSIVHQMGRLGRRLVFCGDDTWTKLFPGAFRRQLANSDSLYVNDFHAGDANITQQLNAELRHADWDLLILHYLGLDHIGHVEGPHSLRVPAKLQEMDAVIQRIHLELEQWRERIGLRSLLLVTGDHGMRDTGGHGGNSYAETNVPLFVTGVRCAESTEIYQQTDIAPTLSVLLGTPIPANSIGSLIPELLAQLSVEQQLYAYHYNARRLVDKVTAHLGTTVVAEREYYLQFLEASELHKQYLRQQRDGQQDSSSSYAILVNRARLLYVSAAREMSSSLATNFINYDKLYIVLGLFWTTVTCVILLCHSVLDRPKHMQIRIPITHLIFGAMCLMVAKDGFCRTSVCTDGYALCQQPSYHLLSVVMALSMSAAANFMWQVGDVLSQRYSWPIPMDSDATLGLLVAGTVLHAALLGSSSFVEEEHQTWYFLCTALLVALGAGEVRARIRADCKRQVPGLDRDVTARNVEENLGGGALRWLFTYRTEIGWLWVLTMVAVVRRLNQTGDKWLSVPDIGDWLVTEENRLWQSIWVGFALLYMLYRCMDFAGLLTNVLAMSSIVLIYFYRTQTGSVWFAGFKESESTVSITIFWLSIGEIVCINYVPVVYRVLGKRSPDRWCLADVRDCLGANVVCLSLCTALLHKPHNIILNAVLLCVCDRVHRACARIFACDARLQAVCETMAHLWLGQAFFYMQGNSNSLASVDLNAGYVGFKSFNFAAAAVLVTLSTYSAVFLSWSVLLYHLVGYKLLTGPHLSRLLADAMATVVVVVAIPLTTFLWVTTAFRSHLFVWTVFSPKLIYGLYLLYLWGAQVIGLWSMCSLL